MYRQEKIKPYSKDGSKKEQVKQMFDHIAPAYDRLNHLLSLGIDKGWRKKAIATLRPYQPKTMMDVATGTGDFALLAAKELKPHQLIGTDISEGMIAIGKEKIQKAGMNIDDLLCVGAVDNILVSSTIGRNKLLIPGEVISAIINGTDELLAELRKMGVGVYATGGETADVGDLVRTIIVDSTVTCRMKRSDVIDNGNIRPGDVIVGLASYGQATYEKGYNGGMSTKYVYT